MSAFDGAIDIETLKHMSDLWDTQGLHVDYLSGLQVGGNKEWNFMLPEPQYLGVCIRVFIYNKHNSYAKLRMALKEYPTSYYVSLELKDNTVTVTGSSGKTWTNPTGPIPTNKCFSFGIELLRNAVIPHVNRWALPEGYDMKQDVHGKNWLTNIYTGENRIVQLHLCGEKNRGVFFPVKMGLTEYTIDGLVLPVGSYATIYARYLLTTPLGERIWVGFKQDSKPSVGVHFNDTNFPGPLRHGNCIITVRNSNQGWLVTADFLNQNQKAELIQRTSQEQFINVQLSANLAIRRINAVCPVIPIQYRMK